MIFESIAAVTAAISGINSLVSAVKEGNANVNSILDRMTGIQDGMNKLEIEKRESVTQPLTPQEAMKLAWAKQSIDRYNEELRLLCHMSVEGEKFWQTYQGALKDSRERHELSVKALIAKKKARKQFLSDLFLYSVVGIIGLMISAIIITLLIFAFKP
jgi:aspartate oxidase|tara:strand:- start:9 stop:482 length:474 start_codon:yes stop_codon:yes gene_type:complete